MTVGVLALQGDFAEHLALLQKMRIGTLPVRTCTDLQRVDRLILPGGESTVLARLLEREGLTQAIRTRSNTGTLPLLGTCAGAILLSTTVTGKNPPPTLSLLHATVERNAYGTQAESFVAEITLYSTPPKNVSFIRAPKITAVGEMVEVLCMHGGTPVLLREKDILAATFHTEVWQDLWLHELLLSL
ncbi:pyridoxal 5'-phosphate synthase glutaminase subunit PdxT [Candidatus Peregrinibacteria bacterium CG10_big_fil_rev_8_21_14_0_10_49_10]|nr:MAG: pyridoxal 5'-phosphate synthase glutaminase subunit PdxT [Candidatus Peregrinibacteria bacterium CG10_big_fil_rev_8_21_14_0_10_49_10]